MTQHYSNPKRASEAHALPDVETFEITARDWQTGLCPMCGDDCNGTPNADKDEHDRDHVGWYWWSCFPGCLPDGEPNGPFATEAEAVEDAQSDAQDDDDTVFYVAIQRGVGDAEIETVDSETISASDLDMIASALNLVGHARAHDLSIWFSGNAQRVDDVTRESEGSES